MNKINLSFIIILGIIFSSCSQKDEKEISLIQESSQDLEIIAETKNKIIMGIAHKNKKIFGLQFHPESIGTKNGKKILKNFLKIINYEF